MMNYPIGFHADQHDETSAAESGCTENVSPPPRKSVVQVYFPARNMTLPYYNDQFDLHCGDLVFVDGKLEGLRGRVVDITYSFKIKLADYKRIIAVADTHVSGEFFLAGSHFVTFDEDAIPFEKVITWFRAPINPEDEYVEGDDEQFFHLDHLEDMGASVAVAERGTNYYQENRVVYVSVDAHGTGYAIVEGGEPYIIEFHYENNTISALTCTCFCSYTCKHDVAAMLQLKETLEHIADHYQAQYEKTKYFAAISKPVFMSLVMDHQKSGSFKLD